MFITSKKKDKNVISIGSENGDNIDRIIKYQTIDFYRVLIAEKKGLPLTNYEEQRQRKEMKEFLLKNLQTDDIEQVNYYDLKKALDGDSLVSRFKYRYWFSRILSIKRDIVNR